GNEQDEFDSSTIRTNVEVINTYNVIITSPAILDQVIDELNLNYGASTLAEKITVSSEENSQVVTVTVPDPKQPVASMIVNEVVSTFQEEIPDIMNVDNVSILTTAEGVANPNPVSLNVMINILVGLVLGLMTGVGPALLLKSLATTGKPKTDSEDKLIVPVIAS